MQPVTILGTKAFGLTVGRLCYQLIEEHGEGTMADFYENGELVGRFSLPLPGRHNLSNATAALAACRLEGVPFGALATAMRTLRSPGRRFDFRGRWAGRQVVDDYAHHPSEVEATLHMARLMVTSGRSPLPEVPQRLVAVFQPHRFSRTAEFMDDENTKKWFYTALSSKLNPQNKAGEEFFYNLLDSPLRTILAVTPVKKIMYNGKKAGAHMAGTISEDQLGERLGVDKERMNAARAKRGLPPR